MGSGIPEVFGALSAVLASESGFAAVPGVSADGEGGTRTAQAVSENRPAMTAIIENLKRSFGNRLKSCPSVPGLVA